MRSLKELCKSLRPILAKAAEDNVNYARRRSLHWRGQTTRKELRNEGMSETRNDFEKHGTIENSMIWDAKHSEGKKGMRNLHKLFPKSIDPKKRFHVVHHTRDIVGYTDDTNHYHSAGSHNSYKNALHHYQRLAGSPTDGKDKSVRGDYGEHHEGGL